MKLRPTSTRADACCSGCPKSDRNRQEGSAVLVVLVVLMIIVIFSMANVRIVAELWDELRLVEHKQQMHWQTAGTNAPANVTKPDYPVDQAEARVGGSRS